MSAFHNDIDPEAGAVLRQHVAEGIIAPGVVDTRSIKEISPDDLASFTQCHFFAGGGLWSIAARMAGWPDWLPLWTGSCPCQGESLAGKRLGADDPRHLWPDFFRLIRARRPAVVVGEQVAAAAGTHWLDRVCSDLESEGYAARAVDIPALAVDAPHERNRLYWIAVDGRPEDAQRRSIGRTATERANGSLVNAAGVGRGEGRPEHELRSGRPAIAGTDASGVTLGDAFGTGLEGQRRDGDCRGGWPDTAGSTASADGGNGRSAVGDDNGQREQQQEGAIAPLGRWRSHTDARRNGTHWSDAEWIVCHDGKARRAKSGIRLLVDGMAGRIGLWRIAGNSIVPQLAAEVLRATLEEFYPDIAMRSAA